MKKTGGGGLKPCLVDFGQALNREFGARGTSGKEFYKTTEVQNNLERDDAAFDVWALGICLFILLSGGKASSFVLCSLFAPHHAPW